MSDCVFCDIVNGEAPAYVVQEWPDTLAFKPLNEVTHGHVLIVPKVHVDDVRWDDMVSAVTFARASAYARSRGQSCNVITSAGAEATQSVEHLHVHYVPRREGDGLALPWTGQQREAAS